MTGLLVADRRTIVDKLLSLQLSLSVVLEIGQGEEGVFEEQPTPLLHAAHLSPHFPQLEQRLAVLLPELAVLSRGRGGLVDALTELLQFLLVLLQPLHQHPIGHLHPAAHLLLVVPLLPPLLRLPSRPPRLQHLPRPSQLQLQHLLPIGLESWVGFGEGCLLELLDVTIHGLNALLELVAFRSVLLCPLLQPLHLELLQPHLFLEALPFLPLLLPQPLQSLALRLQQLQLLTPQLVLAFEVLVLLGRVVFEFAFGLQLHRPCASSGSSLVLCFELCTELGCANVDCLPSRGMTLFVWRVCMLLKRGEVLRGGGQFVEGAGAAVEYVEGVAADESFSGFGLGEFRTIALLLLGIHRISSLLGKIQKQRQID